MNIIRNLPTPIAGLALGSVALGNLLQAYSPTLQLIFSILSLIIIVLLTIKFITNFEISAGYRGYKFSGLLRWVCKILKFAQNI